MSTTGEWVLLLLTSVCTNWVTRWHAAPRWTLEVWQSLPYTWPVWTRPCQFWLLPIHGDRLTRTSYVGWKFRSIPGRNPSTDRPSTFPFLRIRKVLMKCLWESQFDIALGILNKNLVIFELYIYKSLHGCKFRIFHRCVRTPPLWVCCWRSTVPLS